jgi:biotin synthase-like enzyme
MFTASLELLRKADHVTLMQAGNEAYLHLFTMKLQLEVETKVESASKECIFCFFNRVYAKKYVSRLINELQTIIQELTQNRSSGTSYQEVNQDVKAGAESESNGFPLISPPTPPQLDEEDYPNTHFWTA